MATPVMNVSRYHEANTRYNLCEVPAQFAGRPRLEQQARSIACLVHETNLIATTYRGFTQYRINHSVPTLAQKLTGYDPEQKRPPAQEQPEISYTGPFQKELALGIGTAFLVGKQLILTAAHCICDQKLASKVKWASLRVVFGFQTQGSGQIPTVFEAKDVYRIEAVWQYRKTANDDWALLKLDREAETLERHPLSLAASPIAQEVSLNIPLYMLGHPTGLPMKLTLSGQVQKTQHPQFFETDLDAFAGNSGSPIFTNDTGNMVGMLLAGNTDYVKLGKNIQIKKMSPAEIEWEGYEKCHKIASIGVVKIVLTSLFKIAHTHFSGRVKHLDHLRTHLAVSSPSTQVHILYGSGGVGKSELAIAFANQRIEDFSLIWSISCGTEEEQRFGYQSLAERLEISINAKDTLSSLIQKVHHKLEQNQSKPWLVILDNFQTEQDTILPSRGGSILITSYKSLIIRSLPQKAVSAAEVLPLEPEEAFLFLIAEIEKPAEDCTKLLGSIGCYPLLLGLVTSYIKHNGIEVTDYLTNFAQQQSVLKGQEGPIRGLEAALNLILKTLPPHAKKWLFFCSWMNGTLIPVSYLKIWLDSESLAEEQEAIMDILEKHALLRYDVQQEAFSLHAEFQRILKTLAPVDTVSKVAHFLVTIGNNDCNFENATNWQETMKKATIWTSHAGVVITAAQQIPPEYLEKLFNVLGCCEASFARYEKAIHYQGQALEMRKVFLTKNDLAWDLAMAKSLNNIGTFHYALGNYEESLKVSGEALTILRVIFGANHPDVAKSLHNIALCYNSQGKTKEAQKVSHQVSQLLQGALGDNHPHVAASLMSSAGNYHAQGNYPMALQMFNEALKMQRDTLSANHPAIAGSLNNIGGCYSSQGNYHEALKMFEEALKIYRTVSGDNHPDIALSFVNIGSCYQALGNYNEALKKLNEALKIQRIIFEKNHPETATNLNNIGCCYSNLGNYAEALKVLHEALEIRRAILGEEHSFVATTLNNIGICYHAQKNYTEALKIYNKALTMQRGTLGNNHPEIATSLSNIAECHLCQGNYSEATNLFNEALKILRSFVGENHPNVATILNNIGGCYAEQRDYGEALKIYNRALEIYKNVFGDNHPDVALSLRNIGSCYASKKSYKEALDAYTQAHKIYKDNFGDNHPDVKTSFKHIRQCQARLNPHQDQSCAIS